MTGTHRTTLRTPRKAGPLVRRQRRFVCLALLPAIVGLVSWFIIQAGSGRPLTRHGPAALAHRTEEKHAAGLALSDATKQPFPRFLMFNVRNYFVQKDPVRSPYPRSVKPTEEREAVARTIASVRPQIVGLIEIGGTAALDDLAARLEHLGLRYEHRFVLERRGEDRALGLLSCFPILRNQSQAECRLAGEKTNRRMLRGILDVTLRAPDGHPIRIIGVHLKSRKTENPEAADSQRRREIRTLAAHLQQALQQQPHTPMLVFGDWNTEPTDPMLAPLSQAPRRADAFRILEAADECGEGWTIYYRPARAHLSYDYIYTNGVLRDRAQKKNGRCGVVGHIGQKAGSDHRAVWCDLP